MSEIIKNVPEPKYLPDQTQFFKPQSDDQQFFTASNSWLPQGGEEKVPFQKVPVNVFDVASYVLNQTGEITTMKLHKLLYYCQAWSLVWDEAPLFNEDIEAWANGPVVRKLFSYHRGAYTILSMPIGNKELLSDKQKETVDAVLNYYGNKPTQWLIELTHLEDPWKNARVGLSPNERGDRVISISEIAEYYSAL